MKNIIKISFLFFSLSFNTGVFSQTWTLLASDTTNDVYFSNLVDGKALYYYYDETNDSLFFRVEVYDSIVTKNFGFTIVFYVEDSTLSQNWCLNTGFLYNKFIVAWMEDINTGIIGTGDAKGYAKVMTTGDLNAITNIKSNNATVSLLPDSNSYILGVARQDVITNLSDSIKVIATVGSNQACNDDIPNNGFGTIVLKLPTSTPEIQLQSDDIVIYPNPIDNRFNIRLGGLDMQCKDHEITLFNMYGQKVFNNKFTTSPGNNNIDVLLDKKLAQGIYTLSFKPCKHYLPAKKIVVN